MKSQTGIAILIVICVGLAGALIWSQKHAADQKSSDEVSIGTYSNKWVETSANLEQQRQVNTSLEGDLKSQRAAFNDLTNAYTDIASNLDLTQSALKTSQDTVTQREAKIAALESQNQELDQRALDLSTAMTNLTVQIADTQKKLAASEGDKAFLEKELQRLITEKAALERQFNDLAVLRAQVSKLKEELSISRRLEWIRQGLFARSDQRGAESLMPKSSPSQPASQPRYDLNVELNSDGSVKVVSPATNNVATTNSTPSP